MEMADSFKGFVLESGDCPVSDPKLYGRWDMVEVGTEDYERELRKYEWVRKERLEKKRMGLKK